MTNLIEHFEQVLGPIDTGWSVDPDGAPMGFQIVRFTAGAGANDVGYATLGLSRHALPSPVTGHDIRHELFMLAPDLMSVHPVVSLLHQVGSTVVRTHKALRRGDVIGPAGALVPGSEMTALYVTSPSYFPDVFATCPTEDGDVVIAWLVPISTEEADFVSGRGWDAFEDRLVEQDPDLTDFSRTGMSL